MLRNLNQSAGGKRILGVPQVGILAAQIASETATGDSGPGILYNESQAPAYAGKYLRAAVTNWPATGTLFVRENGSYDAIGLTDGLHTFSYDLYVDGYYDSYSAFEVAVGVVDVTAPGATLTGTASITPGAASGTISATAPGATLTGTSSISAGAASGPDSTNANAPGATLTGTSSITGGDASGSTSGPVSLTQADIDAIAAAVLLVLNATTIPVNIKKVNDRAITGSGVPGDSMRPV